MKRPHRRRTQVPVVACALVAATAAFVPATHSAAATGTSTPAGPSTPADPTTRQAAFAAASSEFGVPLPVLMSVSYNESLWEAHGGKPSFSGGYGPMNLTNLTQAELTTAGFSSAFRTPDVLNAPALHTAAKAAALAGTDLATVETNDAQNIRAGAALLASYEKQYNHGTLPPAMNLTGWTVGVARYAEASETKVAQVFADDVFTTIRTGQSVTTQDGQALSLAPQPWAHDDPGAAKRLGLVSVVPPADPVHDPAQLSAPECPAGLDCSYSPDGFFQLDPNDKSNYGGHDPANRPVTTDIRYITLHDNEESNDGTLWLFHDPSYAASANYEVRSEDGHVTQMMPTKDIAWDTPTSPSTSTRSASSRRATRWRGHLVHARRCTARPLRWCATWRRSTTSRWTGRTSWGTTTSPAAARAGSPRSTGIRARTGTGRTSWTCSAGRSTPTPRRRRTWSRSTRCSSSTRRWSPAARTSRTSRRSRGRTTVPSGRTWPGRARRATTSTCPSSRRTSSGCAPRRVTARRCWPTRTCMPTARPARREPPTGATRRRPGRNSSWPTALRADGWRSGSAARRRGSTNDFGPLTAAPVKALTVVPKAGKASVPVYTASFPEASAYPAAFTSWYGGVPRSQRIASKYVLAAGQAYVTDGKLLQSDWYDAYNIDGSAFMDQTDFQGATQYYLITYNHRMAFVNAADVDVVPSTS